GPRMAGRRCEFAGPRHHQLKVETAVTVKPHDVDVEGAPRSQRPIGHPAEAPAGRRVTAPAATEAPAVLAVDRHDTPLYVLYGSNLGTAEGIATKLGREGTERGFAVTVGALDDHVSGLPTDGATIVVCASYNGLPPENAARFCAWLQDPAREPDACAGVRYTVFGCGNSEWATTYQAVPTAVDGRLEALGAQRVHPRGEGDARSDFDAAYRGWHGGLWADLARAFSLPDAVAAPVSAGPRLTVSLVNRQLTNPVIMSYRAQPSVVRANRELAGL